MKTNVRKALCNWFQIMPMYTHFWTLVKLLLSSTLFTAINYCQLIFLRWFHITHFIGVDEMKITRVHKRWQIHTANWIKWLGGILQLILIKKSVSKWARPTLCSMRQNYISNRSFYVMEKLWYELLRKIWIYVSHFFTRNQLNFVY